MSDVVFEIETDDSTEVVVELRGSAANVIVVDSPNLQSYRRGGSVRHVGGGGFFKSSPAILHPGRGHWYVVVNVPVEDVLTPAFR